MAYTNIKKEVKEKIEKSEKQKEIQKEKTKIKKLLADVEKEKVKAVESVIDNAAFMAVTLRELMITLEEKGLIEEYQNGANQKGIKKSCEVEIYNTMIKNYISAMKQLLDLSPTGQKIIDDGLDGYLHGKS